MPDEEADGWVISDPELITQVRNGDRQAFGELYRRHSGPATTLARQFARNAAEADDLVAESFARVLDNLLEGRGPDSAFRAYLFTTIRNTAYDRTRKDKRLQFTDDMTAHDVAVAGDDPVLMKMESGLVASAFAQLPERWQAVLWHTQVEGESPAQVGRLLGMAPGAVSSLAFRAREGLREAYLQAHLAETAAEQCRSTVERLGAWTRGGLSKRETQQVDGHLRTCDRCQALAAELQEVNHNLRGLLAPLLLGGAAVGYLATLGPVTPLAVPGALSAGAGSAGSVGSGSSASGGAGAGSAGAGSGAGGAGGAGAGAAGAGGAGATGVAAGSGAAGSAAAAAAATTAAVAGSALGPTSAAAAGASASGAAGAAGLTGLAASLGIGGLVAAGAVLAAAVIAVVVLVVATKSPDAPTSAADQGPAAAAPATPGATDGPGPTDLAGAVPTDGSGLPVSGSASAGTGAETATNGTETPNGTTDGTTDGTAGSTLAGGVGADTTAGSGGTGSGAGSGAGSEGTGQGAGGSGTGGAGGGTGQASNPPAPATTDPGTTSAEPTPTEPTTGPATTEPTTTEPTTTEPTTTEPTTTEPTTPPANLVLSDPVAGPIVAGGTATITVTVSNTGGAASVPDSLAIRTPTGVTVSGVDVVPQGAGLRRAQAGLLRAGPCVQEAGGCTASIPAIDGGGTVTVTITLAAAPNATGGEFTLTFLGVTRSFTVVASSVVGTPDAPLVNDGRARTIQVLTTSPDALGPLTFRSAEAGVGFTGTADCDAGEGPAAQTTCQPGPDGRLALDVVADRAVTPGPLSVTVTDAQGREMILAGPDGQPLPIGAAPAELVLTTPTGVTAPPAGGTGSVTFTALNLGGTATTGAETVDVTLADGLRNLIPTTPGVTCPAGAVEGTWRCMLPAIGPGARLTLGFQVGAEPSATIGRIAATVSGQSGGPVIAVPVTPGITGLTTGTGELVADGTTGTLRIDVAVAATVTDPGPITFSSGSEHVRLSCTGEPAASTAVCPADGGGAVTLAVVVDRDQPAGVLPLTVTDAGNRTLDLLGPEGPIQVVPAPADLRLGEPTSVDQPVAGGTGRVTFTAENAGGRPTTPTGIDVAGTGGLALAGSATGNVTCDVPAGRCTLPAIDPGGRLTVTLTISAAPATTTGTVTVTPDGGPAGPRFTVRAGAGVTGLTTTTGELVADGAARTVPVTAALAPTVTTPGPITLTSGSPAVRLSCGGATPDATATCTPGAGNGFDLVVVVDPEQDPGPLPITAADAGARPLNLSGPDGPVQIVRAPANLTLTLGAVVPPAAGGQGSVTVTVANTGGRPSGPDRSLELTLPPGLSPGSDTPGVDCAGTTCSLPPVAPGASVTVTVTLAADPSATGGPAEITLGEVGTGPFPVPVAAGITALSVPAGTLLADGRPQTVTVTARLAAGVTDPGSITVTGPDGIDLACPDTEAAGPTVTCGLGTGTTVPLTLTPAADAPLGPLALTARDAGGRTIPDDFRGLVVRSPARLDLGPVVLARPLVAGGGGAVALSVTNSGGIDSAPTALTLLTPDGVTITGVTAGGAGAAGRADADPGPAWPVGALAPGETVTLTVDLAVDATVPADAELRLAVGDTESSGLAVPVAAGIDRLVVDPDGPVVADGRPTDRTVTVEAADGIVPGEVTLVAGGGITLTGPTGCPAGTGGTRVTCGDRRFSVAISAPPGTPAGPLPLTAIDAGGRPLPLTALTVAAPAALDLAGDPEIVAAPVAGGTGTVRFLVTNSGGVASADGVPIRVEGTEGLTPVAVTCTAGQVAPDRAADDPAGCALPSIDPGSSASVEVTVRAAPTATAGTVTAHLGDASQPVDLTVGPGLALLSASTTAAVVADGTPIPLTLVATPADGTVTGYGAVTIDTGTDRVTIGCGGATASRVTCDLATGTVPLELRIAPGTTGPLTVTTTDAAGRAVPNTFDTLVVLRPSALTLSELRAGPLVAGIGGTATVTVDNTGDVPTADGLPIAVTATDAAGTDLDPALLRLSGGTPADAVTCTDQGCALRPLAPGTPVTLTLDLAAAVTLPGDRVGISVGVGAITAGPALAEVRSPVRGVTIDPAGPLYPDGRAVTRTVTVRSDLPDPAVTFLHDAGVTLTGPACPEGPEPDRTTCTGGSFQLTVTVPAGTPAGPLTLTAVDAGGRTLDLTPLTVAEPAALTVVAPDPVSLIAGGTGSFDVVVRNTGGSPSAGDEPLRVTVPTGFTVTGLTVDGTTCPAPAVGRSTADGSVCGLPVIAPGDEIRVAVGLAVEPDAPSSADAELALAGQDPVPATLTVKAGITGLAADPATTLPANGSTRAVTLTATVADGVRPGSVTVTAADPAVRVTCADGLGSCPVRADGSVPLLVTVGDSFTGRQLTLTATDAGGRPIAVDPITVLSAPALTADDLTTVVRPVAGGPGRFAVTVHNTGGSPYPGGEPITASAPGFDIAGIDPGDGSTCTGPCVLPPIPAGRSVTVVVTIDAPATTRPGTYALIVSVVRPQATTFAVVGAFHQVVATPGGPFPAGTAPTLALSVERSGDATTPGPLTFTSTSPLVTLAGCGGSGSALTCAGDRLSVTVTIGATQRAGALPVVVTDAAGNRVPLTDGSNPLQVAPAALTLSPLSLTWRTWGSTSDLSFWPRSFPQVTGTIAHLHLTVTNPGGAASSTRPVQIGVTNLVGPLTWIRPLQYCGTSCTLPSLGAGKSTTLEFWVVLPPAQKQGSIGVTIDGATRYATIAALPAPPGVLAAPDAAADGAAGRAAPTDPTDPAAPTDPTATDRPAIPTVAGEPSVPVEPTGPAATGGAGPTPTGDPAADGTAATVTGTADGAPPEPTTVGPTSGPPSTTAPTTTAPSTTAPSTTAPSTTGPTTDPGTLGSTKADGTTPDTTTSGASAPAATTPATGTTTAAPTSPAGPTGPSTAPAPGGDTGSTEPAPPPDPAHLMLGRIGVGTAPTAGGSGTVTLTVRNDGGQPSAPAAIRLTAPDGVTVAAVTVDGAHAGSGTSCTLPAIAPGDTVGVTVTLSVAPDARPGQVRIDIPGDGASVDLPIAPAPSTPPSATEPPTPAPPSAPGPAPVTRAGTDTDATAPAGPPGS